MSNWKDRVVIFEWEKIVGVVRMFGGIRSFSDTFRVVVIVGYL